MTATLPPVPNPLPPLLPHSLRVPPLLVRHVSGTPHWFRNIPLDPAAANQFFPIWQSRKEEFMRRGWSVRKDERGQWNVQQWLSGTPRGYTLTPMGAEMLERAFPAREQAELSLPEEAIELEPLPAHLEAKLRGYQVNPVRQLYRALTKGEAEWGYPGALDLSDMGVGKSVMDLAAALATGLEVVVICPPVGRGSWEKAFRIMEAEPLFLSTYEAVRGGFRSHIADRDEEGRFRWRNSKDIILILDEAQAVRHSDTLTVECFSAAVRQRIPIICASATIALSPIEFRFAGRIVGLHKGGPDFDRFLREHGCSLRGKEWKWNEDNRHLRAIHSRLFPRRGCRVRKQELGEDCPETEITVLPFVIPEGERIEQAWKEAQDTIDRQRRQGVKEAGLQAMRRRAFQTTWKLCENLLVPHVAERVRQDVRNGNSVALFMNFNSSRLAMAKALGTTAGFYGGQTPARRLYYEREFQANRQHILISNVTAGGASVSLHDEHGERPRIAYLFPGHKPVPFKQASGRVDRVGGQSKSFQYIPCVKGAMTERMVGQIRRKMARFDSLNDGGAGDAQF